VTPAEFQERACRWRKETDGRSVKKHRHPDYVAIIDAGPEMVPLILEELRDHGGHWFVALSELTGECPIPTEYAGNIAKMRECWLNWGKKRGLV